MNQDRRKMLVSDLEKLQSTITNAAVGARALQAALGLPYMPKTLLGTTEAAEIMGRVLSAVKQQDTYIETLEYKLLKLPPSET